MQDDILKVREWLEPKSAGKNAFGVGAKWSRPFEGQGYGGNQSAQTGLNQSDICVEDAVYLKNLVLIVCED